MAAPLLARNDSGSACTREDHHDEYEQIYGG